MDNTIDTAARQEFLAGQDEPALYAEGKYEVVDQETDQITYSEDRTIYMVSDMEYTKSYTLDIEGELLQDATVNIFYSSIGLDGKLDAQGDMTMEVLKTDDANEKAWLWSDSKKLGFILYFEPIE